MQFLLFLALFPVMFFYGMLSWGFVAYKAHAWFLVTHFALSPITFVQAIAIATIAGAFHTMGQVHPKPTDEKVSITQALSPLVSKAFHPWIVLFVMFLTKLVIS